jgi:hypothetical protein
VRSGHRGEIGRFQGDSEAMLGLGRDDSCAERVRRAVTSWGHSSSEVGATSDAGRPVVGDRANWNLSLAPSVEVWCSLGSLDTRRVVMVGKNAFYGQSGGVSAVINASACGVLASPSPPRLTHVERSAVSLEN